MKWKLKLGKNVSAPFRTSLFHAGMAQAAWITSHNHEVKAFAELEELVVLLSPRGTTYANAPEVSKTPNVGQHMTIAFMFFGAHVYCSLIAKDFKLSSQHSGRMLIRSDSENVAI